MQADFNSWYACIHNYYNNNRSNEQLRPSIRGALSNETKDDIESFQRAKEELLKRKGK